MSARGDGKAHRSPWCKFCGRTVDQVEVLVIGPDPASICDVCHELVGEVIAATRERDGAPLPTAPPYAAATPEK